MSDGDFPAGTVHEHPPAKARIESLSRKISHAMEQPSPWATTTEPKSSKY